jgi:hypothetical protein
MRTWFQAIAIFIALAGAAHANAFGKQDIQQITALDQRLLEAQKDDLQAINGFIAQRAPDAADCVSQIREGIDAVSSTVSQLSNLVQISSSMAAPLDESLVNRYVANEVDFGLGAIAVNRQSLNRLGAYCGTNPFIAGKV